MWDYVANVGSSVTAVLDSLVGDGFSTAPESADAERSARSRTPSPPATASNRASASTERLSVPMPAQRPRRGSFQSNCESGPRVATPPARASFFDLEVTLLGSSRVPPSVLTPYQVSAIASALPARIQLSSRWRLLYSSREHGRSLRTLYRSLMGTPNVLLVVATSAGDVFGAFVPEAIVSTGSRYGGTGETFVWRATHGFQESHSQRGGCPQRVPVARASSPAPPGAGHAPQEPAALQTPCFSHPDVQVFRRPMRRKRSLSDLRGMWASASDPVSTEETEETTKEKEKQKALPEPPAQSHPAKDGETDGNDYYVMPQPDSLVIGGGGGGPAICLNGSLERGTSWDCATFRSPPLHSHSDRSLEESAFEVSVCEVWALVPEDVSHSYVPSASNIVLPAPTVPIPESPAELAARTIPTVVGPHPCVSAGGTLHDRSSSGASGVSSDFELLH